MSELAVIRIVGLNPLPWTAPTFARGRAYKSAELRAYQEAVKEAVASALPEGWVAYDGPIELWFAFRRQLVQYQTPEGKWVTKHRADATNMQKALEDALQKPRLKADPFPGLFRNDNQVTHVTSTVVEQTVETVPAISIVMLKAKREWMAPDGLYEFNNFGVWGRFAI